MSQGLSQVQSGQEQIQQRMEDMANDKSVDESGMYITKDMLQDSELKQSVNQYSEDDGNIVLLNVELSDDPFSKKAMNTVEKVEQSVTNQVKVLA